MANKLLHIKAEVLRENLKVEEGVVDAVVGSTSVLDRMGDVIDQDGWQLDTYTKTNPVILWGHNVREERPPIGKALKVWTEGKQSRTKRLMFKVKFDLQDSFAAEIFRKVKDGFVNTVSVGFLPVEWEELNKEVGPFGGRKYTKQELLELSFVPVPANPEAVVALRSLSVTDKRFEPIALEELYSQVGDEVAGSEIKEEPKVETSKEEVTTESVKVIKSEETPVTTESAVPIEPIVPVEPVKPEEEPIVSVEPVIPEPPKTEEPVKPEETPKVETPEVEPKVETIEEVGKGVIGFSDHGTAPETEGWDGPGEMAKCDMAGLKIICAWFDSANADNKGAYKLPHHNGDGGYKAVWRGVAAAMASLLGARGGVSIPDSDKKGVYNHLKKHYAQFDKPVPDFKMVEDQILAILSEEVQAVALEREDKYAVRLIKRVLENQKEDRGGYNQEQVKRALEIINLALSLYKNGAKKGGEK